jgi:hypothetical protein
MIRAKEGLVHPDHKVDEIPLDQSMKVTVNGDVAAESGDVVKKRFFGDFRESPRR